MAMLTSTDIQWSQFQHLLIEHVEHLDFCYYSWECFASIVQQLDTNKTNVYMFTNILGLVKIPARKNNEDYKLLFHSNSMYMNIFIFVKNKITQSHVSHGHIKYNIHYNKKLFSSSNKYLCINS